MGVIKEQELIDAIEELKCGRHTIQTCEKMAAVITCLEYMYPKSKEPEVSYGYSGKPYAGHSGDIGEYGDSEFLRAIAGKDQESTWKLMDEAMTILAVTNKRLYEHIMNRL